MAIVFDISPNDTLVRLEQETVKTDRKERKVRAAEFSFNVRNVTGTTIYPDVKVVPSEGAGLDLDAFRFKWAGDIRSLGPAQAATLTVRFEIPVETSIAAGKFGFQLRLSPQERPQDMDESQLVEIEIPAQVPAAQPSMFTRWWLWAAIGGGIVVLGVAAFFVIRAVRSPSPSFAVEGLAGDARQLQAFVPFKIKVKDTSGGSYEKALIMKGRGDDAESFEVSRGGEVEIDFTQKEETSIAIAIGRKESKALPVVALSPCAPSLVAQPATGPAPVEVDFAATLTGDVVEGAQLSWNFGDGSDPMTGAGTRTSHRYEKAGTYTAAVTCQAEGEGNTGTARLRIVVQAPSATKPDVIIIPDLIKPISVATIWRYTGTPCNGDSCPGWQALDNSTGVVAVAAADGGLYKLHDNGMIFRYTGTPCSGGSCPGWQQLDNNPKTKALVAAGTELYQFHSDGMIWRYTGTPCSGNSCPGWQRLDNNPKTKALVAAGTALYQLHNDGMIWRYTGTPCSGSSCPGWQRLDNNPKTTALAAGGTALYQLHNDGMIWRYTGMPCSGNSCPGWQRLDSNPRTKALVAAGTALYQLHDNGMIWRYTGTPCSGTSCPGWQRLDNNPRTRALAAAGSALYQLHDNGMIWRSTGTPCSGTSCPGWQRLDNNPRTRAISAATDLYQLRGK